MTTQNPQCLFLNLIRLLYVEEIFTSFTKVNAGYYYHTCLLHSEPDLSKN